MEALIVTLIWLDVICVLFEHFISDVLFTLPHAQLHHTEAMVEVLQSSAEQDTAAA